MLRTRFLIVFVLLMLLAVPFAAAQEEELEGEITDRNPTVDFEIELSAGELLVLETEALDDELDTILTLTDPDGRVVAENDDIDTSGGNFNSRLSYTAEIDGTYIATVGSFHEDAEGEFILRYVLGDPLELPDALTGTTSVFASELGEGESVEFEFELTEGDVILLQTQVNDGNLDTVMVLLDPNGDEVAQNDDTNLSAGNLNSVLAYEVEESGTYVAVVESYGESEGEFTLSATVSGGDESTYITQGTISEDQETVEFQVTLTEGENFSAYTQSLSGRLDTILTLYDADGDEVVSNDDIDTQSGNYNSAINFEVDEGGTYTVEVAPYDPAGTGAFLLTLNTGGEISETDTEPTTVEASSQSEVQGGEISNRQETVEFPLEIEEGDTALVETEAQSNNLDTILTILDPNGDVVTENDDRSSGNLNSAVAFTAEESGEYTAVVSSYGGTEGEFTINVTLGGPELIEDLENSKRINLSGPELTLETENFVIHYTTEGDDAATEDYVQAAAEYSEEAWRVEIDELGWAAPPPDGTSGGDGRVDVYLVNIRTTEDDCIFGYAMPEYPLGDNPNTPDREEESAAASYLVVDNDYIPEGRGNPCGDDEDTALGYLRTTLAHEFHHVVQFGYDANEPHNWYFESIASWIEIVVAGEDEEATIYVPGVFDNPDVCFGSKDQGYVYGHWLFIQSLADAHGDDFIVRLWEEAIESDGFEALENALEAEGDTVENAMARYYVQNLVRDYDSAQDFNATVSLEEVIDETGNFEPRNGAQELAANYYEFAMRDGVYSASADDNDLQVWAVGINGDEADVYDLSQSDGVFSNEGYDNFYLVVVNVQYDENTDDCDYANYELEIDSARGEGGDPTYQVNAENFDEPR